MAEGAALAEMSFNIQESELACRKRSHEDFTDNTNVKSTAKAQRKKLTPAEREARDKEAAEKKAQRDREAAEKQKKKEEKVREAEEKKKQKEEEDRLKAEEKEQRDKIKAQKAQEKEDKKRAIEEAKEKEARKQPKLKSFFGGSVASKKASSLPTQGSPNKAATSTMSTVSDAPYRKLFMPYCAGTHVTMAPTINCRMDGETKETKASILDEYLSGTRSIESRPFRAAELFQSYGKPTRRGKQQYPVRHIMEAMYKDLGNAGDAGPDGQNKTMKVARQKLSQVPLKVIAFSQDVRPPYHGTCTFKQFVLGEKHMRGLAKCSTGKLLPLDYDYDSEAEWQEEEGEDLDGDDEEEELDDEDDMDGFLDDAEDTGPARRLFINTMEPESTGVCFEGMGHQAANPLIHQHKMEMMIESLDETVGLDPWTATYWSPEPKAPVNLTDQALHMPPPPAPAQSDAFAAIKAGAPPPQAKLVKAEIMNDVKKAILDNKALSKVGIIDFVYHQFRDNASRTEVKNTIETVAEKQGAGRAKEWCLRPGHEMAV
ncbi:Chromatin assembly factor 1 subunit-like protein [Emericellopsis cladophorae]|uniref:Chromatin assembly factor 1 subunit-like protein n=1 Tax=Emericellopsis cladophorae TaxID=2686198 RepID=A0A9Q0BF03_9HYPO|nr:Chromatin assembly factor 1 subunit-like protein [Emericellopsis cladophorae]KAI6782391.1 Chromatin assembly factor 1 subunit-like protein [Emericellopsis cladophorae]